MTSLLLDMNNAKEGITLLRPVYNERIAAGWIILSCVLCWVAHQVRWDPVGRVVKS